MTTGNGLFIRINSEDEVDVRLDYLATKIREGGKYPFNLEMVADTRSKQQNRFLWGWLYRTLERRLAEAGYVIASDDGREFPYTSELLHAMFKETFLTRATIVRGDRERILTWSTTQLLRKKVEEADGSARPSFKWYVDQIKAFSVQVWDIHIPEPPLRGCDYPELLEELRTAEDVDE